MQNHIIKEGRDNAELSSSKRTNELYICIQLRQLKAAAVLQVPNMEFTNDGRSHSSTTTDIGLRSSLGERFRPGGLERLGGMTKEEQLP